MNKEIEIPEGYEARIEGNKVILVPKESEDERIRKEIYGFLNRVLKDKNVLLLIADRIGDDVPNMIPGWISYLEKQKEQPNIELIQRSWYVEGYHDREFFREPKWIIKTGKGGPKYEKNEKYGQLLEQKPAEWSDEDEQKRQDLIAYLVGKDPIHNPYLTAQECADWFKSLRPYWKPSEEQMKVLKGAVFYFGDSWVSHKQEVLESLYNDLKKLM